MRIIKCFIVKYSKAASVLCAIGIGFGLGSYFLYKLYCRYIQPDHRKKKKKPDKRDEADACVGTEEPVECEMGNSGSNESMPVSYNRNTGVQFGSIGLENHTLPTSSRPTKVRQRKRTRNSQRKSSLKRDRSEPSLTKRRSPSHVKAIDIIRNKKDGGFEERLIHSASDISNIPPLSGSLKGNLSLKSLYEKNCKYGLDDSTENGRQRLISQSSEENIQVEISESQDLLTISSALLTPPSDEDLRNDRVSGLESSQEISNLNEKNTNLCLQSPDAKVNTVTFADDTYADYPTETCNLLNSDANGNICNESVDNRQLTEDAQNRKRNVELSNLPAAQTTDSSNHTSPFHSSGSGKAFSNYTTDISGNVSLDDEERDSSSPLYKLRSPDRHFRQSLLNRLHEYAKVDGSSTSTSQNSTPDISPYHRARSCSVERQESTSEIATPDSEIFTSSAYIGESTDECFEQLEHEVYDIEDEFAEISAKLAELKTIASKHSDDFDFQLEYTPSDPVAKKACEIVEKTRVKIHKTNSMSFSESYSSSDGAGDTDGVDLSWDSEHMTSQGKNSPAKQKLNTLPQTIEVENEVDEEIYEQSDELSNGAFTSCDENMCNTSETAMQQNHDVTISDTSSKTQESNSVHICSQSGNHKNLKNPNGECVQCTCDSTGVLEIKQLDELVETDGRSLTSENTSVTTADLFPSVNPLTVATQISDRHDIAVYASQEWKGETPKAQLMRKAYSEVPKHIHCRHLRRIRGDNYCGIRGTVFQCLINSVNIKAKWRDVNLVKDSLKMHYNNSSSGLSNWTFANRLPCDKENKLALLSECVSCLFSTFDQAVEISSLEERTEWVIKLLNSDYTCDIQIMEGVKILMYINICNMYKASQAGEDVPIFVWLLLARDSSETPALFLKHHLNPVGDSAGLEQIEMFLLGHSLGVTIQVARLQQFQQEDFISYFPDDMRDVWPQISLLAEDDRHYNVPVA